MISPTLLSIFVILLIVLYVNSVRRLKKPDNFPPGPPSLPIYGAYWIVLFTAINDLSKAFVRFGKFYKTKLVGLMLGPYPAIVINDPKLAVEMLAREDFDGRADLILGRMRSYWKRLGIFFTDGYFWYVQRRQSLRLMRDYGFGRRDHTLESAIQQEIKEMLDIRLNGPKYPAEKEVVNGELICMPFYFSVPFINGMVQVFAGTTLQRKDYDVIWDISKAANEFQRGSNDLGGAIVITPWLKDVLPSYSGFNIMDKSNKTILNFYEKLIRDAKSTQDENHDRHFLDAYLRKMNEERRLQSKTTFSEDQLVLICTDYTLPASNAVQTTVTLLVERMILQPELQEKMHEEIDRVVGRDRLPNLDDRKHMPYVEACIRETMRMDTLLPLGFIHRAVRDTTLGGYTIPENTVLAANFAELHRDKELWGDPDNFRPERFIRNGQLDVSLDKSLPFSAGKRLCAGETYARQTLFLVVAAFMQAFRVSTPDGRPLSKPYPRLQGLTTTVPKVWVRAIPR